MIWIIVEFCLGLRRGKMAAWPGEDVLRAACPLLRVRVGVGRWGGGVELGELATWLVSHQAALPVNWTELVTDPDPRYK